MKSLVAPVLATASFSLIALSCLGAASSLQQPYSVHEFQNMNSGIWTSGPVRIDPTQQNLERVAAVSPALTQPADDQHANPKSAAVLLATAQTQAATDAATENVADADGAILCQQKYKSYRQADNTYQPLGGGSRRQCELSATRQRVQVTGTDDSQIVSSPAPTSYQADWCQARYSSYNPIDNTYQPFGGGQRRVCMAPVTLASNG